MKLNVLPESALKIKKGIKSNGIFEKTFKQCRTVFGLMKIPRNYSVNLNHFVNYQLSKWTN